MMGIVKITLSSLYLALSSRLIANEGDLVCATV